jgi:hypothetical protein
MSIHSKLVLILVLVLVLVLVEVGSMCAAERIRVEPKETDELLANPGMGWETFHRTAAKDPALADLPSSVAYYRFYWNEVEPAPGKVDFEKFDALLAEVHAAAQKLAFRIMTAGTGRAYLYSPAWLKDLGCPGYDFFSSGGRTKLWAPDLDSPIFLEHHLKTIALLGERYDGHPDVCLVDIGSVGLWGEWHYSGTAQVGSDQPVPMPTPETRKRIIDAYLAAFKKTPMVMLIGDTVGMKYALGKGAGWRADCLGDMGGFSPTWNHMKYYPEQLERCAALEAWKQAPVAFESCWDMRKWVAEGWDVDAIFNWALQVHVSYLNNKSAPIPEGAKGKVENFIRKMGYRFVLRSLEHAAEVKPGEAFPVAMAWENVGVAPCYADYVVALSLADKAGARVWTQTSKETVRTWLPGKVECAETGRLPQELAAGSYALQVAIVDPATGRPVVKLAMAGGQADGWYPVSTVTVKP